MRLAGSRTLSRSSSTAFSGGRTSGGARIDPLTGRTTSTRSTGTYLESSGCPSGQVVMSRVRGSFGKPDKIVCGIPPAPAPVIQPAPQPLPPINVSTNVSPTFQQSSSPQVSPVIQTQSDSPGAGQSGTTQQQAASPQQASTGSGASPEEVQALLDAERQKNERDLAAAIAAYQTASEAEREAVAADFEQTKALLQAQISASNQDVAASGGAVPSGPLFVGQRSDQQPQPKKPVYTAYILPGFVVLLIGAGIMMNRKKGNRNG